MPSGRRQGFTVAINLLDMMDGPALYYHREASDDSSGLMDRWLIELFHR